MNGLRPSYLKPGDQVICRGRVMTFKRRITSGHCGGTCFFTCQDYVGLNGPKDDGTCTMTDAYVIRHCQRAQGAQSLAA